MDNDSLLERGLMCVRRLRPAASASSGILVRRPNTRPTIVGWRNWRNPSHLPSKSSSASLHNFFPIDGAFGRGMSLGGLTDVSTTFVRDKPEELPVGS